MNDSERENEIQNSRINKDISKTSSTGRLSAMPNLTPTRHTVSDPTKIGTTFGSTAHQSAGFNHYQSRLDRMK